MLKGKTAFISGASRGIGRAIAETYAKNGADLFLAARSESSLNAVAQEIRERHSISIEVLPFDVSDNQQVKEAFKKIFKLTKKLDVVVNNAGLLERALLGMATKESIERTYSVNVYGMYYILQYAAKLMSRNKFGSIINLTSIMGTNGSDGVSVYSGSKAAVIGATKSLAKELAPLNIRVNAIAPGFIDTDMTQTLSEEKYQEMIRSIKMNRAGTPEDVANTALYLASDLSLYVTGQIIGVDGGMLI